MCLLSVRYVRYGAQCNTATFSWRRRSREEKKGYIGLSNGREPTGLCGNVRRAISSCAKGEIGESSGQGHPLQNNKSRRRGPRQIQNAGKATFLFLLAFVWGAIGKSILRTQSFPARTNTMGALSEYEGGGGRSSPSEVPTFWVRSVLSFGGCSWVVRSPGN